MNKCNSYKCVKKCFEGENVLNICLREKDVCNRRENILEV